MNYNSCPACKDTGVVNGTFCNCPFGIAKSQNKTINKTLVLKEQMLKSLLCMSLELHESVADDIKKNVLNYVNALEKQISELQILNNRIITKSFKLKND